MIRKTPWFLVAIMLNFCCKMTSSDVIKKDLEFTRMAFVEKVCLIPGREIEKAERCIMNEIRDCEFAQAAYYTIFAAFLLGWVNAQSRCFAALEHYNAKRFGKYAEQKNSVSVKLKDSFEKSSMDEEALSLEALIPADIGFLVKAFVQYYRDGNLLCYNEEHVYYDGRITNPAPSLSEFTPCMPTKAPVRSDPDERSLKKRKTCFDVFPRENLNSENGHRKSSSFKGFSLPFERLDLLAALEDYLSSKEVKKFFDEKFAFVPREKIEDIENLILKHAKEQTTSFEERTLVSFRTRFTVGEGLQDGLLELKLSLLLSNLQNFLTECFQEDKPLDEGLNDFLLKFDENAQKQPLFKWSIEVKKDNEGSESCRSEVNVVREILLKEGY